MNHFSDPGKANERDPSQGTGDGLDLERRRIENRNTAVFLLLFVAFCAIIAYIAFPFYVLVIELCSGIIYIAIFMFAYSTKYYSTDSSSLYSGVGFLFTFAFEILYFYTIISSGSRDFRLAPPGFFLWICAQWYQAFSFLIVKNRKRPEMTLAPIIAICSIVAAGLLSFHFFLRGAEVLLETTYRAWYLGANAVGITLFYGAMLIGLLRDRKNQPDYFAVRTFASIIVSIIACVGMILSIDSSPALAFVFYFIRFVALSLCYNANVTLIMLSPYRALYSQLSYRADELAVANTRLKGTLAEKEILLGEVHHRVKNNLQVISSLLNLQRAYHKDEGLGEALEESQNRIRAMALVHEMLYQNRDFSSIDFSEYIERVVAELFNSSGRPEIRKVMECDPVQVPIDAAITSGLIVNELITNCLKHAFPSGRAGTISIRVKASPSTIELAVEDDGVGLPPGIDIGTRRSMGFSLIASLSSQLRGKYEVGREKGTRIALSFPREGAS